MEAAGGGTEYVACQKPGIFNLKETGTAMERNQLTGGIPPMKLSTGSSVKQSSVMV